ncbi:MAG: hypothetical protein SPK45_07600 [Anaerovoracaceae bacterium]|nr:hypothetical protein [Anaerovoracaceae bacterium]
MVEIPFLVKIALILIVSVLVAFILKRLKRKKAVNPLKDLSTITALFKDWERAGLLHWQVKGKTLLLEQSLAVSTMSMGPEKFKKFLNLLAQFKNAELIGNAYEQQRIDLETAAVRDAQEKTSSKLTDADIQRIRQNARENMKHIDMKNILDAIHEFDIMIIRSSAISSADATQEGGELVAVGHFDGKKVEMAMWDEIKNDLKEEK